MKKKLVECRKACIEIDRFTRTIGLFNTYLALPITYFGRIIPPVWTTLVAAVHEFSSKVACFTVDHFASPRTSRYPSHVTW